MISFLSKTTSRTLLALLCAMLPSLVTAAFNVTTVGIDANTGGEYRNGSGTYGNYGSCFSVVAQASPRAFGPEVEVGEDFYSEDVQAYENRCSVDMVNGIGDFLPGAGGCTVVDELIPSREAGLDRAVCITENGQVTTEPQSFGFRFFRNVSGDPDRIVEDNAYAWSFIESNGDDVNDDFEIANWPGTSTTESRPSQYNACLDTYRASTFDNELFEFDPLSGIVDLREGGNATVAFYFLTAAKACREQTWELYVNLGSGEEDLPRASGTVSDFAFGKYLVFDLQEIPDTGVTLRLATQDAPGSANCPSFPTAGSATNSHISGIFVSGTTACAPAVELEKYTNGHDGDAANGTPTPTPPEGLFVKNGDTVAQIEVGDEVEWTYRVTNIGAEDLRAIVVTDPAATDLGATIVCDDVNNNNVIDELVIGASIDCKATLPGGARELELGQPDVVLGCGDNGDARPTYENLGEVVAVGAISNSVAQDDDVSHYCNPPEIARLGDFVWEDVNGNGIQDPGEPGIPGVTVELKNDAGEEIDTTTTDANGLYSFEVNPGTYSVVIGQPDGFEYTTPNAGGDDAVDSDANPAMGGMTETVTVDAGETNNTLDGGLYRPASLGDFVWEDENGNGIQDPGEPGVPGVSVELLDADMNPIGGGTTTTTDANGAYSFTGLRPGTYFVEFTAPDGRSFTTQGAGGDPTVDSNAGVDGKTDAITLASGENDPTIDAGVVGQASLGDRVWLDENRNGRQDDGEPGIEGVRVELLNSDMDPTGLTDTTNANGIYGFAMLEPGTYFVRFTDPAGLTLTIPNAAGVDDAEDSDAVDESTGTAKTGPIELSAGENDPTNDAGYFRPVVANASLGDFVWNDLNQNGQQDAGEPGIQGVNVTLLNAAMEPTDLTDITDENGVYGFGNLLPGTYFVLFQDPDGLTLTTANAAGVDDAADSDAIAQGDGTSKTGAIVLAEGENDPTNDAGYFRPVVANASLGDFIWEDFDADGEQDALEPGIAGVTVTLLDENMDPTGLTDTTDANGAYGFADLLPGTYFVRFDDPAGFTLTTANADGVDDAADSDALEQADGTSKTGAIVLAEGENDPTNDAGYFRPAVLGDFVWEDLNRNGLQDDGEPGVGGVTVKLKDADGLVIGETTTSDDGFYEFTVRPGTYSVMFVLPDERVFTVPNVGDNRSVDSDADPAMDGMTLPVMLASGEVNTTVDAGLVRLKPDVDIRKQEEGPDSRVFAPGDTVDFEIKVTNTGSVDLSRVEVSDPLLPACERAIGNLPVGESETYVCSTVLSDSGFVEKLFKDTFSIVSYNNNDGTDDFAGPWFENDKADGYTQDPTKGNVIIGSNKKLWLDDYPHTGTDPSAKRTADLRGLDSAIFEFDWETHKGVDKSDSVVVEISRDGGDTWKVLKTFTGFSGTRSGHETFDISNYIAEETSIRFRVNKFYGGRNETFKVDNVVISGKGKKQGDGFVNEACVSGKGAGQTVSDCDTSEVIVEKPPVDCKECIGGLTSMTLKIIAGSPDRPDDERIRVREGGLGGYVLYDSKNDGDSNPTVPTGGSFTFAIRDWNKPIVVTVQGDNHRHETIKATFDTDCSVELGDVDGNNYIKFEVTAATTVDNIPICPVEPPVSQCVEIKNKKYGKYLKGKSDNRVWLTSQRGSDTKWILEKAGSDRYLIRSAKFNKTIDGNNRGYKVYLDNTPEDDDLWIFKDLGSNVFSLKNKVSHRYLDGDSNGSVDTSSSASDKDKKWIVSYLDAGKCEASHSPKPRSGDDDDDDDDD